MVKFTKEESGNQKIRQLVEAARELFWKFGIKRVTVEEICSRANVSKVTFYKYFENKTDIAIWLLDGIYQESLMTYRNLMASDIPFEEKVRETIRMKFEGTRDLSNELFEDILGHPDDELKKYYADISGKILQEVIQGYAEAQKKGEVRKDLKVEFMLFFMGHMMELAHDERVTGIYGSARDAVIEMLNFFFYGIMPRNTDKAEGKESNKNLNQ